jgi:hypothetical protein
LITIPNLFANEITFKIYGKVVKEFSESKINSCLLKVNVSFIRSIDKTLFNTWRRYERIYIAYSFYELLDGIYG